jgi:hypothetical protein
MRRKTVNQNRYTFWCTALESLRSVDLGALRARHILPKYVTLVALPG